MNIVLDTNILVSALWSPGRQASDILYAIFSGQFTVCYDHRIMAEYETVLHYPKFPFTVSEIHDLLEPICKNGISVVPTPVTDISFDRDETDRKFYEVAKFCHAILISGNLKHYPDEPWIMCMTDFCAKYL